MKKEDLDKETSKIKGFKEDTPGEEHRVFVKQQMAALARPEKERAEKINNEEKKLNVLAPAKGDDQTPKHGHDSGVAVKQAIKPADNKETGA